VVPVGAHDCREHLQQRQGPFRAQADLAIVQACGASRQLITRSRTFRNVIVASSNSLPETTRCPLFGSQ
jgi:hypothetical protein